MRIRHLTVSAMARNNLYAKNSGVVI
jgi:hypothetical protein